MPLGRIQLARVTGSAHVVERTAEVIRRSPADAVAVYVTLRGQAWFRLRDGTWELRPGQVLICDADQPFGRGFARGLEELAIKVPRAALAPPLRSPVVAAFTPDGRPLRPGAGQAGRPGGPGGTRGGGGRGHRARPGRHARGRPGRRPDSGPAGRGPVLHRGAPDGSGPGGGAGRGGDRDQRAAPVPRLRGRRDHGPPAHPFPPPAAGLRVLAQGGAVAEVAARCGFTSAALLLARLPRALRPRAGDVRRGASLEASHFRHVSPPRLRRCPVRDQRQSGARRTEGRGAGHA